MEYPMIFFLYFETTPKGIFFRHNFKRVEKVFHNLEWWNQSLFIQIHNKIVEFLYFQAKTFPFWCVSCLTFTIISRPPPPIVRHQKFVIITQSAFLPFTSYILGDPPLSIMDPGGSPLLILVDPSCSYIVAASKNLDAKPYQPFWAPPVDILNFAGDVVMWRYKHWACSPRATRLVSKF